MALHAPSRPVTPQRVPHGGSSGPSTPAPGGKNVPTPHDEGDDEGMDTAQPGANPTQRTAQMKSAAGLTPNAGAAGNAAGRAAALRAAIDPNQRATMNDVAQMSSKAGRRAASAEAAAGPHTPGLTSAANWEKMFPHRNDMGTTGIANPPPQTNFLPGDSGAHSLADHVTLPGKPVPMPTVNPDGTKSNVPSVAANLAYYRDTANRSPASSPLHPNNSSSPASLSPEATAYDHAEKAKEESRGTSQGDMSRIASQYATPAAPPNAPHPDVNLGQPLATTHENTTSMGTPAQPKPTGQLGLQNFTGDSLHPNAPTPGLGDEDEEAKMHAAAVAARTGPTPTVAPARAVATSNYRPPAQPLSMADMGNAPALARRNDGDGGTR